METNYQTNDVLHETVTETPKSLRTLTTLTFIGCGLGYLGVIFGLFFTKDYATQHAQLQDAVDKSGSGTLGSIAQSSLENLERNQAYIQKMYDHRFILWGTTAIFITLCLIGAMRMRKLRRSGFPLYVVGELAPLLVMTILVGFYMQGWQSWLNWIIPIVFVALYASQRKYLVRD
jgi:hypothetical protein